MTVRRVLLLLLLAYVSLDLANPLMAGAFDFDPDQSVEAVRASRSSPVSPVPLRTTTAALERDLDRDAVVRVAHLPAIVVRARSWRGVLPAWPHSGSFTEPASPED